MILNGPNIKAQLTTSSDIPQPVLTIAQLLMHNSLVRRRENQATSTIKHIERETPLPIYLGIIRTKTRKHELVDDLYELGLSISYNCVLNISTELGNQLCHQYRMERAVYPPALKDGYVTTGAVDTLIMIPALLVPMTLFMELEYLGFSTQTLVLVKFLGSFSPCQMIWIIREQ